VATQVTTPIECREFAAALALAHQSRFQRVSGSEQLAAHTRLEWQGGPFK